MNDKPSSATPDNAFAMEKKKNSMIRLVMGFGLFLVGVITSAQPPDEALSPVEAVSMLGKGILFEPQSGDVDLGVSAPYKSEYGTLIKDAGFLKEAGYLKEGTFSIAKKERRITYFSSEQKRASTESANQFNQRFWTWFDSVKK